MNSDLLNTYRIGEAIQTHLGDLEWIRSTTVFEVDRIDKALRTRDLEKEMSLTTEYSLPGNLQNKVHRDSDCVFRYYEEAERFAVSIWDFHSTATCVFYFDVMNFPKRYIFPFYSRAASAFQVSYYVIPIEGGLSNLHRSLPSP